MPSQRKSDIQAEASPSGKPDQVEAKPGVKGCEGIEVCEGVEV